MTKPIASLMGATGVVLFAAAILRAAGPTFWVVSTQADFLKGDVESVSIDEMGRVTLGPETTLRAPNPPPAARSTFFVDPDDKYIWSLAVDPSGVVYAGTGEKGLIYRGAPDGTSQAFY